MKRDNVVRFDQMRRKNLTAPWQESFKTTEGVEVVGRAGILGLFGEHLEQFPYGELFAKTFVKRFENAPTGIFGSIAVACRPRKMKWSIHSHFNHKQESVFDDMIEVFLVEPAILSIFPAPCYREQWFSHLEVYLNRHDRTLTKPAGLDPWALYLIDLVESLYNTKVTMSVPQFAGSNKLTWLMGNELRWDRVTYNFPDSAADFRDFINS